MSEEPTSASGTEPQTPVGDVIPAVASETMSDTVAFDTHRKLLGEKKRRDEQLATANAELEALRNANTAREESELKQKEDYKALLDLRDSELKETKALLAQGQAQSQNAVKLQSFFDALGGAVDKKYWGHVDLDKIVVDPDTGSVDDMSVTKEVDRFRSTYPEVIKHQHAAKVPSHAPMGAADLSGRTAFDALSGNQQLQEVGKLVSQQLLGK